ncbi:MAG: CBS domain-containing protein [Thermoplasmata archaeon]|nr:CBS domain-containing protein [Thermoplasmata archaeon]
MDVLDLKGIEIEELLVKDVMSSSAVTATKGETLSEVISRMKKDHLREIPVLEGNKPVGLVSYSSFLLRRSLPLSTKVEQVMHPAPRLEEDMPITKAVEEMMASGVMGAPVVRNEKMVGFVSRTDIIKVLPNVEQLKNKKVSEFMTKNPQFVTEKEGVRRAQMLMKGLMEKSLPVVDSSGRLVGAVSMHEVMDIIWSPKSSKPYNELVGSDKEPPDIAVGSIMSQPAISVSPSDSIGKVASLMLEKGLATIFVHEGERLVGVVSQADLMEQVISLKKREGVYVQITGLVEEDPDVYNVLYDEIEKAMNRIDKIQFPRVFTVHIQTYHSEGMRSKYSIHGRLTTDRSMYYASQTDWNLYKTMDALLNQLEKTVKREHEKTLDLRKKKATEL